MLLYFRRHDMWKDAQRGQRSKSQKTRLTRMKKLPHATCTHQREIRLHGKREKVKFRNAPCRPGQNREWAQSEEFPPTRTCIADVTIARLYIGSLFFVFIFWPGGFKHHIEWLVLVVPLSIRGIECSVLKSSTLQDHRIL